MKLKSFVIENLRHNRTDPVGRTDGEQNVP